MNRAVLITGAVALTAISALAFFDWRRVTVESENGRRVYKRVSIDGRVRLVRQLSSAPCVQNRSWGYDRNGIWVDDGCRAEFEYEQGRNNNDWNIGGILDRDRFTTKRIKVESRGNDRAYKRIDTSGGVRLVRTLSDRPCVLGRSWGYDRNGVWTDNGCRGEFEVRQIIGNGRDPVNNNGVPHWAIGDWRGSRRDMEMTINSGGSVTLRGVRSMNDIRRGTMRGNRIDFSGWADYTVVNRGGQTMILVPTERGYDELTFIRR